MRKKLAGSLILSKLDFGNVFFNNTSKINKRRMQKVLNATFPSYLNLEIKKDRRHLRKKPENTGRRRYKQNN